MKWLSEYQTFISIRALAWLLRVIVTLTLVFLGVTTHYHYIVTVLLVLCCIFDAIVDWDCVQTQICELWRYIVRKCQELKMYFSNAYIAIEIRIGENEISASIGKK